MSLYMLANSYKQEQKVVVLEDMLVLGIFSIYSPFVVWGSVRLSAFVGLLYQPQMVDGYGAFGGMKIGG
jgi:hypothetical protein